MATPSKLRVLAIGHSYILGANRAILRSLARDPRFEITVAAPEYYSGDLRPLQLEPEPEGSKLLVCAVPARLTQWVHLFSYHHATLRRLIESGKFDIVHCWEEPYIYSAYQVAKLLGHRPERFSFMTFQNIPKSYPFPFSHFEKTVLTRAQGWLAGGQMVFDALTSKGYPPALGRVLPPAVDTQLFKPLLADQKRSLQTKLGLKGPVIGYLGRLTEEKGIGVVLQALDQLNPSLAWSAYFMGSGELEDTLREWVKTRGLETRVRIELLRHDQVAEFLPSVDLLVAPSQTTQRWKEQFGRMLIEAFACGVPVIGSDSGEIPAVLGGAGRVVGERDVEGWTHAIGEYLRDPSLRVRMADQGLERAKRFSAEVLALEMGDFFEGLKMRGA